MAITQRIDNNQGIARDRRGGALVPCVTQLTLIPMLIAIALTLAASVVAFAAPQSATPAPTPPAAPQTAAPAQLPAQTAQPDKPSTPATASQSAALLIAKARVGDAQMAAKEYDAAIATFQSLIPDVNDRGKGELWAHIGEAYRLKLDYANSLQAFQKAFALIPDDVRIITNLGVLYEAMKDNIHARQYYEKSIALNPNSPLVLNNLAFLLAETDTDLDLALVYARSAQSKAPDAPEIADTVGWIDLKKNMIPGAIAEFHKITLLAPNNPTFHFHYAMALKKQGDSAAAAKECKSALDSHPPPALLEQIKQECSGPLPEKK